MIARVLSFPRRNRMRHSRSGNRIVRHRPPTIASVLGYLDRMRSYAERLHDRDAAAHYERVWRFYFELTHGPLPPRQPSLNRIVTAQANSPKAVPKWKASVLARPMRKVVARREVEGVRSASGWAPSVVRLSLECGHVVEELAFMLGDRPAFRRRCNRCAA